MKRNFFLITAITLILAIGLHACAHPHEHSYSQDWSHDDTYHWHQPLCNDVEPIKQMHTFSGNKCMVCGFELEPSVNPGGEQPGGEQPGGEQPGGEQPGGEQPGGEQPGGEQPGGEQPGGEQPGGEQPGGDVDDSDYEEPDEVTDIDSLPDKTEKPDKYYDKIEDVFKDVEFKDLTENKQGEEKKDEGTGSGAPEAIAEETDKGEQSELDKAWAKITQTLRNVELGKGFAFGDILIDESRNQTFYSAKGTWQFKGMNGSINNATKLNIKEELYSQQMWQTIDDATYYANMHSAYEINGDLARSYKIKNAAAYVAQDIFDSFRYHLGEFQFCIGSNDEGITKEYAIKDNYYYLQVMRRVIDGSMGVEIPIITTMQAAYYNGYLVAFRHTMKYDMELDISSDAYILVTNITDSIARPLQDYIETPGAPSWVPVPHENLDPTQAFNGQNMTQVTDPDEAYDAYNVFANSVSMAGYGFDYVAPRGDVKLKTKNTYSETEITFDKYSADGYLIHKKTTGMDFEVDDSTIECEQYLDSEYVYERLNRKKNTENGQKAEAEDNNQPNRKFKNEGYSDFYSYVLTYDITVNIMTLLSSYCEDAGAGYYVNGTYLPSENFTLYKKDLGDYTIYEIKFDNFENENGELEPNSTQFDAFYAFDSAGMLCGVHIKLINTSENTSDDASDFRQDVTEIEILVGDYKVTIPQEYKDFEDYKPAEGEKEGEKEPYLEF